MPWANRLFSKIMKGKILNFLREVEKVILVIDVQVSSKKLDFPSLRGYRTNQTSKNRFFFAFSVSISS